MIGNNNFYFIKFFDNYFFKKYSNKFNICNTDSLFPKSMILEIMNTAISFYVGQAIWYFHNPSFWHHPDDKSDLLPFIPANSKMTNFKLWFLKQLFKIISLL